MLKPTKTMNNINKSLEKFWLIVTFLVVGFCIYEFIIDDVNEAKWYLLFLIVPIAMYVFRRYMRIRYEKMAKEASKQKKK